MAKLNKTQIARAIEQGDDDAGETGVSGWAREVARAHAGESSRAGLRFYKLADYLVSVAEPGKSVKVSFSQANTGAALNRGATGNPVASWRLALQRTRQLLGGSLPYGIEAKVLADESRIEVSMPASK
jgi:hypothetical protein